MEPRRRAARGEGERRGDELAAVVERARAGANCRAVALVRQVEDLHPPGGVDERDLYLHDEFFYVIHLFVILVLIMFVVPGSILLVIYDQTFREYCLGIINALNKLDILIVVLFL